MKRFARRARVSGSLAAVLMVLLPASALATPAGDLYVSPSGDDGAPCTSNAPCRTLDRVQQVVATGDTVHLAPGEYPGSPELNVDDVTYVGEGPGESKLTLPADSYGVQINADDITMRNLTVTSGSGTIEGDTWGFTIYGSNTTLTDMVVSHLNNGIVFGHGITVTGSTFTDLHGNSIGVSDGAIVATDNDFGSDNGIFVTAAATVVATGNTFNDTDTGIYVEDGSAGGTVSGNRFSATLQNGIRAGYGDDTIDASNNWWGCNEGVGDPDCATVDGPSTDQVEPHLVLHLSASPTTLPANGSTLVSADLLKNNLGEDVPDGPNGLGIALTTDSGTLSNEHPKLIAGLSRARLYPGFEGALTLTATLDNETQSAFVAITAPVVPQNTTPPAIRSGGAAEVGTNVVFGSGVWSYTPTSYGYEWLRCDADGSTGCEVIAGQAKHYYKPAAVDAGHTLRLRVTAHNSVGDSAPVTSDPTPVVHWAGVPALTTAPPITSGGAANVGISVLFGHGVWTNAPTALLYEWLRCDADGVNCSDIGQPKRYYPPVAADAGHTLRFRVTARNPLGDSTPWTSDPTPVVGWAGVPAISTAPIITSGGSANVGTAVVFGRGVWLNAPTSLLYEWLRCDADGATNCTAVGLARRYYKPTAADAGHTLRYRVTGHNPLGDSPPVTSDPTPVVDWAEVPMVSVAPSITSTGPPQPGMTLTGNVGRWTNPATSYAYQWSRCDADGETGCTVIAGQLKRVYKLTATDLGHRLRFTVIARNPIGNSAPETSDPSGVVSNYSCRGC